MPQAQAKPPVLAEGEGWEELWDGGTQEGLQGSAPCSLLSQQVTTAAFGHQNLPQTPPLSHPCACTVSVSESPPPSLGTGRGAQGIFLSFQTRHCKLLISHFLPPSFGFFFTFPALPSSNPSLSRHCSLHSRLFSVFPASHSFCPSCSDPTDANATPGEVFCSKARLLLLCREFFASHLCVSSCLC